MVKVIQSCARLLLLLLSFPALVKNCEAQGRPWVSVRTENFFLVSHLDESEARSLANNLEEFRAVFSQLLPRNYFDGQLPGVILVFADDADYSFFKPLHEGRIDQHVAGYFRPASDLSYITLGARVSTEETKSVLFHEYVHSLVRNSSARAPLWYNEGLAEYYSAYDLINERRQARFGGHLARHLQYLRTHALLPLSTLLDADRFSPLYLDQDKRHIFYAQSWALIHYLLSDPSGERERQLTTYLTLTARGADTSDAIREAFQIEPSVLEHRLADYVRSGRYLPQVWLLTSAAQIGNTAKVHLLSEAEAQAQLGDLLLRTDRYEEAHAYLQRALALDSHLATARISLALLHLQEGHPAEAKEQLQQAIKDAPTNYLAHYYYADLLRRDCSEVENTPVAFIARTTLIKEEINKTIELAPDFLDAYGLLVLTNIERSPQLMEAADQLEQLLKRAPSRQEFKLLRAKLDVRRKDFASARVRLRDLLEDSQINETLHHAAQETLDDLSVKEKLITEQQAASGDETATNANPQGEWQPCDMPEPGPQFKAQRFAGQQTCGRLEKVECADDGITLFVKTGERTLKLHTLALSSIRFVTYTRGVGGRLECGARRNPDPVLVTYRLAPVSDQMFDGELKAVEFVPEDWLH